ncbi:MAG: hypothetical protein IKM39_01055 [Clostridia bacterium]|nr:hypothetical protein [Clostridia bacterium]
MNKKMIAPILITVLIVLFYLFYLGIIVWLIDGIWQYIIGLVPVILAGVLIAICFQRIKEIRSGEEDDLSQY